MLKLNESIPYENQTNRLMITTEGLNIAHHFFNNRTKVVFTPNVVLTRKVFESAVFKHELKTDIGKLSDTDKTALRVGQELGHELLTICDSVGFILLYRPPKPSQTSRPSLITIVGKSDMCKGRTATRLGYYCSSGVSSIYNFLTLSDMKEYLKLGEFNLSPTEFKRAVNNVHVLMTEP